MARNTQISADNNAPPITRILAEHVARHPSQGWEDAVEHEAHRTFLNWLGCAIGAARHETADITLAALAELATSPQCTVAGRNERVDMAAAALINGVTSHTFDFDDTHLKTIIHPAGPVASAALALGEHTGASGRSIIDALVLGIDVACRIGNAMYPDHYDRGWHITGTTGTLGAAAACARILDLDVHQTQMALGIAASQPVGLREQFGTMTKPFHPGAAARAGLLAALLAGKGFTASERALEAPRGFVQVTSDKANWNEVTDELGKRFEISFNTYKPFACGIVIHPSIDACVQLKQRGVHPEQVERIELQVHSLVLELTGKKEPTDGLAAKFSVYHGCAAGMIFGKAGEAEYDDSIVQRRDVVNLRRKVIATVNPDMDEAAVVATAVLSNGERVEVAVEHAIGSLQRPMSNSDLERKFHELADPVIDVERTTELIDACWALSRSSDVRNLCMLMQPG
ncbi:MmgE/PrpD family protein [Alcaligenes sp. DN25]|uniref:MmgE/PrpD family protein n=1 Tax=Alcaligenes TaxID=507 RepID=UPI0020303156|nr:MULTISPECIES: MmgE/PrpD family protein [Alcaligenes]URW83156.1 MmgE/PrpD family protein [Alcaligenes sp. DN25]WEA67986.1 MmgE/PrpD family protein [Alcaligenes faecalis]